MGTVRFGMIFRGPRAARHPACRRGRGFSFLEVLFAIMIMGVGLVMLAALFPVAVRQTAATRDDTYGGILSRNALQELSVMLADGLVPETGGKVRPLNGLAWQVIRGNLVVASDPAYAWVPLYRRSGDEGMVEFFVISVRCRNRAQYGVDDVAATINDPASAPATLEPRGVDVTFDCDANGIPRGVKFAASRNVAAAAPGAFLILSNDKGDGRCNGRIYQLGEAIDAAAGVWALQGGYDVRPDGDQPAGGHAFLVGRGYVDPAAPSKGYGGLAQDIGVARGMYLLRGSGVSGG